MEHASIHARLKFILCAAPQRRSSHQVTRSLCFLIAHGAVMFWNPSSASMQCRHASRTSSKVQDLMQSGRGRYSCRAGTPVPSSIALQPYETRRHISNSIRSAHLLCSDGYFSALSTSPQDRRMKLKTTTKNSKIRIETIR